MSVVVLAEEAMLEHRPSPGHPERPERLSAAMAGLEAAGFGDALVLQTPTEAPTASLLRVHSAEHVQLIEDLGEQGRARVDADTHMSQGSLRAARLAAGAGLDAIVTLDGRDSSAALCVVRPPGHHATPTRAMGFCLFNNVAVTAKALTDRGDRVAIIDFDAHHGNGTQDAFYSHDDVLFISLHEYPQYPGTGAADETGVDEGSGYTINLPLPSGATGDVYLKAFDEVIEPALESFAPDWLLISAGFDAHRADPLTNMGLTSGDYADLSSRIGAASASGKRVLFLEGGYDLTALADSTAASVGAFLDTDHRPEPSTSGGPGAAIVERVAQQRTARSEGRAT